MSPEFRKHEATGGDVKTYKCVRCGLTNNHGLNMSHSDHHGGDVCNDDTQCGIRFEQQMTPEQLKARADNAKWWDHVLGFN